MDVDNGRDKKTKEKKVRRWVLRGRKEEKKEGRKDGWWEEMADDLRLRGRRALAC